jgi:diguanylate cyclase (GGDEF)-like protein
MSKFQIYTPRLNGETLLFLLLMGCTILASTFHVTFVYGITFAFTSIFLFLLFRLYGLTYAVIATLLTFLFSPNEMVYSFVLLVEISFVGAYFYIKKRAKMFFVDALFWLTLGVASLFFLNKDFLAGDALYFLICKEVLNGLFNVLMADMLLAYFPFYKFITYKRMNKNNVSIHQLLSHITIISVMIPFFLIIQTKGWSAHEYDLSNAKSRAEQSVHQIQDELLPLRDPYQKSKLNVILEHYRSPDYEIILTDRQNKIITATSHGVLKDGLILKDKVSHGLYEVFPSGEHDQLKMEKWRSGYFVFRHDINGLAMKAFIAFPIAQFQDQIFKEFLIHIRLSVLFLLITMVMVWVLDRLLMKNIKQLITVTTGLPNRLTNKTNVDWPQANIAELRLLTQNLQEMAQKLKETFQESLEINRTLSYQTDKLRESEEKLHQIAYYDVLTLLPNRLHFQKYVRDLIQTKQSGHVAVIFIDLNQFKQVNDTLGHDAGDRLLQLTADKLRILQGQNREVFRLGGDEFVIVHEVEERDEIQDTLAKISQEFSSPFTIGGQVLYITGSVGVSVYPDDGQDLDTLVKYADIAMYVAKEKGENKAQFFNETMKNRFQERLLIESALRKVVDHGGFELFYQPKVKNGRISSLEALLRWNDPVLGSVSPAVFIPIAEEIGVISQIDEWALLEACRQNKTWQDEDFLKVPISVNISAKNFQHDQLVCLIEKALLESGLNPEYLKLEITESVFIHNPEHVSEVINQIKSLGVSISIDDFGKGYSSLIHVLQLPIDEIKIDKDFIKGIDQNEKQAFFIRSIIDMAHGLHLNIVAEGIETEHERDLLIDMGCDELQGYLFSPPVKVPVREYV